MWCSKEILSEAFQILDLGCWTVKCNTDIPKSEKNPKSKTLRSQAFLVQDTQTVVGISFGLGGIVKNYWDTKGATN